MFEKSIDVPSGAKDYRRLDSRYRKLVKAGVFDHSFAVCSSDGGVHLFGAGEPEFQIISKSQVGDRSLHSLDLLGVTDALLAGDIRIDGSLLAAMDAQALFKDFHPLIWTGRFLPTLLLGSRHHDERAISAHYDRESEFFEIFLDTKYRCYTQGCFVNDDDPLEEAIERKLQNAFESLGVESGARVLDIGGGWGAFALYASRQGMKVTTLTLSQQSEKYMRRLAQSHDLDIEVVRCHFYDFKSSTRFDGIVNMGTTEHLPNYRKSIAHYEHLLKPGGRVYIDSLAMRRKHRVSSFMSKHIYPGQSSPLVLHHYLRELSRSPFLISRLRDQRWNYFLTTLAWATRLESSREQVESRWGPELYREFWLFLFASASSFRSGRIQAFSIVFGLPSSNAGPLMKT